MTKDRTTRRPGVVFCGCVHYDVVPETTRRQVLGALLEAGLEVEVVDDLCGMAARRDPVLTQWAQTGGLRIVACYPRTVRWLFHAAGVAPAAEGIEVYNMRIEQPEEIVSRLLEKAVSLPLTERPLPARLTGWIPWFPVIDYDRCKACRQCLNFCLFGVYTLSKEGRVEVTQPMHCKTNCPACAKSCPHKAIVFPKYSDPPINGAEVIETPGQDLGQVLKGDVHDLLRQRGAQGMDTLRRDLDIPPDVLASLSAADWQRMGQKAPTNPPEEGRDSHA